MMREYIGTFSMECGVVKLMNITKKEKKEARIYTNELCVDIEFFFDIHTKTCMNTNNQEQKRNKNETNNVEQHHLQLNVNNK